MRLLTTEKFRPRPLTIGEVQLRSEASRKRGEVYDLMDEVLPVSQRKHFWQRRITSPKATLPVRAGLEDRQTRVWLERDLRSPEGEISVMIDEVSGGRAISPKQQKLGLDRQRTLYGEEFLDFTAEQHIDLMDATWETVGLVKAETERVATQEIPAIDAVPQRFFARVFSSLSS